MCIAMSGVGVVSGVTVIFVSFFFFFDEVSWFGYLPSQIISD